MPGKNKAPEPSMFLELIKTGIQHIALNHRSFQVLETVPWIVQTHCEVGFQIDKKLAMKVGYTSDLEIEI